MLNYAKVGGIFFMLFNICVADDTLTQINDRLIKYPITYGNFVQTKQIKILNKPLESTGSFVYQQTKGVIWKTIKPVPAQILINENSIFMQQEEQSIPADVSDLFQALLRFDLTKLSETFLITGSLKNKSWQVQLEPKEDMFKNLIAQILLTGDTEVRYFEIIESNGNTTKIHFDNLVHPEKLTNLEEADFANLSP
jgi:outer membrane lipoprotein-sorting protein